MSRITYRRFIPADCDHEDEIVQHKSYQTHGSPKRKYNQRDSHPVERYLSEDEDPYDQHDEDVQYYRNSQKKRDMNENRKKRVSIPQKDARQGHDNSMDEIYGKKEESQYRRMPSQRNPHYISSNQTNSRNSWAGDQYYPNDSDERCDRVSPPKPDWNTAKPSKRRESLDKGRLVNMNTQVEYQDAIQHPCESRSGRPRARTSVVRSSRQSNTSRADKDDALDTPEEPNQDKALTRDDEPEYDLYGTYPQSISRQRSHATINTNTTTSSLEEDDSNVEYVSTRYYDSPTNLVMEENAHKSASSPSDSGSQRTDTSRSLVVSQSTQRVFNGKQSFAMTAHERDIRTEHVQCIVVRNRTSPGSHKYPVYELILEDSKKPLIIAQKMRLNRTSNYHLFDMTRAQIGSKLSKKNGNYLGKLRARNLARTEYIVVNQSSEREELASVYYNKTTIIDQLRDGCQPRDLEVLLPPLDCENIPQPFRVKDTASSVISYKDGKPVTINSLSDCVGQDKVDVPEGFTYLRSKEPILDDGNYRLNFNGRVNIPSVKNFQLVIPENPDNVICQFGKIGEDRFILDYKAPLNAIQAFSMALTQFNL